jgi:pimeloyl-ACP methyl ester carboxylesterase
VALILGLMDALGIERAHLVGHSYGGALSLALAIRHPERVRSLLLLDSAAPTYPDDRRSGLARLRWLNNLFLRSVALREKGVRKALERSVYDDTLVTSEMVRAYFDRLRIEGATDAYYGLTAPVRNPAEAVDLAQIAAPTLAVWGADDQLILVDDGRQATARIPGSRFEVLEKTGHLPMEERPEDVLRLAKEFWAGVEGRPGG